MKQMYFIYYKVLIGLGRFFFLPLLSIGFVLLMLLSPSNIRAQNIKKDSLFLYKHIEVLSSDSLMGRSSGSIYEKRAAGYIVSQLKLMKVKPYLSDGYLQEFEYTSDSVLYKSRNIIAYISNKADSTILLMAHYDHIGLGGARSRSFTSSKIHPGADDNASGVSVLLLLAKRLKKNKKYNYIVLFPGSHENGLWGSRFFAASKVCETQKLKCIINIDMVGRLDIKTPILLMDTAHVQNNFLQRVNGLNTGLYFRFESDKEGDHSAFNDWGVPLIFITTGVHDDYHKVSDNIKKINFYGMLTVTWFIEDFIEK